MELKQFLEKKDHSHLLTELENNFTITPKVQPKLPWNIMDRAKEVWGKDASVMVGRRSSKYKDTNPKEKFYAYTVFDTSTGKIIHQSGGWIDKKELPNRLIDTLRPTCPGNWDNEPRDLKQYFPEE